jgi:hypothetical protein
MTFLNCVIIWEGCRQLFIFLRRRFPRYNQTGRGCCTRARPFCSSRWWWLSS